MQQFTRAEMMCRRQRLAMMMAAGVCVSISMMSVAQPEVTTQPAGVPTPVPLGPTGTPLNPNAVGRQPGAVNPVNGAPNGAPNAAAPGSANNPQEIPVEGDMVTFSAFAEPVELSTLVDYAAKAMGINISIKANLTGTDPVLGRSQLRPALTLLALSFGVPDITLVVGLAFVGQDVTDALALSLESLNLFPPLVLFAALLVHEVLTAGIPFSLHHSETMPRSGRLFLVFGMALLVVSFTIFNTSTTDATTGQIHNILQIIVNALFSLSALILGFPYLGWVVWRKREELIGDEGEFASIVPLFNSLDRIHWGVWLALGIGIMFGASGLCCLSALLLTPVN